MGQVSWQREGHVALVVITDPERHNAMSVGMWQSQHEAMVAIDADLQVRVALLRGAG